MSGDTANACPIDMILWPDRYPCRLERGHDGQHAYSDPEPWDDEQRIPPENKER
jgi:hypothetical protein